MSKSRSKPGAIRKSEVDDTFDKSRIVVWVLGVQMLVAFFEFIITVQHTLNNGPLEGTLFFMRPVLVDWPLVFLLSTVELIFYSALIYFVWTTRAFWAVCISTAVIVLGCVFGIIQLKTGNGALQLQSLTAFISVFPIFSGFLAAFRYHKLKTLPAHAKPERVFE